MPLKETTIVDWREQMVLAVLRGRLNVSDAGRMYGLSRPTVRLWRDRYLEFGRSGLVDRSHAPLTCPHRVEPEIEELVLAEHRRWDMGSKKLWRRLKDHYPDVKRPSRSTIDQILKRNGRVKPQTRRPKPRSPFGLPIRPEGPGEVNTIDHKGQFRLLNGKICYPLTMMDPFSRFLLACEALESTSLDEAWPVIVRVFKENGLPLAVQTDNGSPFGTAQGRVSTFSVRLMKLGVQPVFSRPGKPQDNGIHERMHRDLKARTARPPQRNKAAQQGSFGRFQQMYNVDRPHEGIGQERPAKLHQPSPRPYPKRMPKPDYPAHFEKRKVDNNGSVKWRDQRIFLGEGLAGETIALEPIDDQIWRTIFYGFFIATLDEEKSKFI